MFTAEFKLIQHPAQLQWDWFLFCLTTRERASCRRRKTSGVPSIPIPNVRLSAPAPTVMTSFVLHVAASLRSDWPSLRRMRWSSHPCLWWLIPMVVLGHFQTLSRFPGARHQPARCSGDLLALKPPLYECMCWLCVEIYYLNTLFLIYTLVLSQAPSLPFVKSKWNQKIAFKCRPTLK